MKKSGKMLAALFLFSSVLLSPVATSIAYAESQSEIIPITDVDIDSGATDTDTDTDSGATDTDTDSGATDTDSSATDTDSGATDTDSGATDTDSGATDTDSGATDTDSGATDTDSGATDTDSGATDTDSGATDTDKEANKTLLAAKITEAKTYLDYSKYNPMVLNLLSKAIASAEAILADTSSKSADYLLAIDNLNTAIERLDPWTTALGVASIEASDQTMYVGDYLDEDMILSWATFTNFDPTQFTGGYQLSSDIFITAGNHLVEPGTHTITYYIDTIASDATGRAAKTRVASKTITLTVLDSKDPQTDTTVEAAGTIPNATATAAQTKVADPETKPTSTSTSLPETGETNSVLLSVAGGATLLAGAYILSRKKA